MAKEFGYLNLKTHPGAQKKALHCCKAFYQTGKVAGYSNGFTLAATFLKTTDLI